MGRLGSGMAPSANEKVTIDNVTKTLSEWCDHYGVKLNTVQSRRRTGVPWSEAFLKPHAGRFARGKQLSDTIAREREAAVARQKKKEPEDQPVKKGGRFA